MQATALRNINKLAGQAYQAGATIPEKVIAGISAQVLRTLVDSRTIEVAGMEPSGSSGIDQHLKAKVDAQQGRIEKLEKAMTASQKAYGVLQAAYDDLARRAGVETAKKPAAKKKAVGATEES